MQNVTQEQYHLTCRQGLEKLRSFIIANKPGKGLFKYETDSFSEGLTRLFALSSITQSITCSARNAPSFDKNPSFWTRKSEGEIMDLLYQNIFQPGSGANLLAHEHELFYATVGSIYYGWVEDSESGMYTFFVVHPKKGRRRNNSGLAACLNAAGFVESGLGHGFDKVYNECFRFWRSGYAPATKNQEV